MIKAYTDYQSKTNLRHWVRVVKVEAGIVHFANYEAGVWYEHELQVNKFIRHFGVRK